MKYCGIELWFGLLLLVRLIILEEKGMCFVSVPYCNAKWNREWNPQGSNTYHSLFRYSNSTISPRSCKQGSELMSLAKNEEKKKGSGSSCSKCYFSLKCIFESLKVTFEIFWHAVQIVLCLEPKKPYYMFSSFLLFLYFVTLWMSM